MADSPVDTALAAKREQKRMSEIHQLAQMGAWDGDPRATVLVQALRDLWDIHARAALASVPSRSPDALTEALRKKLARAAYVAEHLMQMIDRETWRAHGADDGQGHYEGDYHEAQLALEVKEWAALARSTGDGGEQG